MDFTGFPRDPRGRASSRVLRNGDLTGAPRQFCPGSEFILGASPNPQVALGSDKWGLWLSRVSLDNGQAGTAGSRLIS